MNATVTPLPARRATTNGSTALAPSAAMSLIPVPGTTSYLYDESHTGVYTTKGEPVLDWCPVVLERQDEVAFETGQLTVLSSRYIVRVGDVTHTVDMAELHDGTVWQSYPAAGGAASRVMRDVLANIVRSQGARGVPIAELVPRSGWHTTRDGQRGYLFPNGAVYPERTPLRLITRPSEATMNYCQTPAPDDVTKAAELFKALSVELIEHAGPSLIGIPAGARALATSLRDPRTSILLDGKMGTGKSLAEWLPSCYVLGWGWPLLATASFRDTPGAVETKMGALADMVLTVDDCPNGASATNAKDALANEHLESVMRSAETKSPIRDRQDRSDPRRIRPGNSIRGLPMISVEHRPRSMRGSLMRRCIIVEYSDTQRADTRWFKTHGERTGQILRAVGQKIIAYIHSVDQDELASWLASRVASHREELSARVHLKSPEWDPSLDSIIDSAAEISAGYDLICAALSVDLPALKKATIERLTDACLHTSYLATDEHHGSDDLKAAMAEVLVKSLLSKRAYVADYEGKPSPALPGLSPGEQGLEGKSFNGDWQTHATVPLYYSATQFGPAALAVNSASLHELVKNSGDLRLAGISGASLPRRLVEAGAAVPPQDHSGSVGTWRKRGVGGLKTKGRWVVLRAGLLDPQEDEPEDEAHPGPDDPQPRDSGASLVDRFEAGILDANTPEAIERLPWAELVEQAKAGQVAESVSERLAATADRRSAALASPAIPIPRPRPQTPNIALATASPRQASPAITSRISPSPATDARVAYITDGTITQLDGSTAAAPTGLAETLAHIAGGPGTETSLLIFGKAYGLPAAKPKPNQNPDKRTWHASFAPATDAGWHAEKSLQNRPSVSHWTNLEHPEHGVVRLCVVNWLTSGSDPFPYSKDEQREQASVDPVELARRVAEFAQLTAQTYRGTMANTAVTMFREAISATAKHAPKWQTQTPVTAGMSPLHWTWNTPTPEQAGVTPHAIAFSFDKNRSHLQPTREARLALDDLEHTGPIRYSAELHGMFHIVIPEWPWPMLPAPTSQTGTGWVTAPILKQYVRLGIVPKILESWSAPGSQLQGARNFTDRVSNAYQALCDAQGNLRPENVAVSEAVKGLYQTLHGKLQAASRTRIRRPDWGLAIRDEAWCSTLRNIYLIAGIQDHSDNPVGPTPIHVNMDEIVYALTGYDTPESAGDRLGIKVGTGLGQFKTKAPVPALEWAPKTGGK